MCNFFGSVRRAVTIHTPYTSSQGHRNAQRANAVTSILGTTLQTFSPSLIIPQAFTSVLISAASIFSAGTYWSEKVIHFIQCGLAAAELGLAIKLLFDSGVCTSNDISSICKAVELTRLLFGAVLSLSIAVGESSKDPYVDAAPPAQAAAPLLAPNAPANRRARVGRQGVRPAQGEQAAARAPRAPRGAQPTGNIPIMTAAAANGAAEGDVEMHEVRLDM